MFVSKKESEHSTKTTPSELPFLSTTSMLFGSFVFVLNRMNKCVLEFLDCEDSKVPGLKKIEFSEGNLR
ncbi:hypothetical protein Hanom_Chr06g00528901 [Helianthus anomalus]